MEKPKKMYIQGFCNWCGSLAPGDPRFFDQIDSLCDCTWRPVYELGKEPHVGISINQGIADLGDDLFVEIPTTPREIKKLCATLRESGTVKITDLLRSALNFPPDYVFVPAYGDKMTPEGHGVARQTAVRYLEASRYFTELVALYEAKFKPIPYNIITKVHPVINQICGECVEHDQRHLPRDQKSRHKFNPRVFRELCYFANLDWRKFIGDSLKKQDLEKFRESASRYTLSTSTQNHSEPPL